MGQPDSIGPTHGLSRGKINQDKNELGFVQLNPPMSKIGSNWLTSFESRFPANGNPWIPLQFGKILSRKGLKPDLLGTVKIKTSYKFV